MQIIEFEYLRDEKNEERPVYRFILYSIFMNRKKVF